MPRRMPERRLFVKEVMSACAVTFSPDEDVMRAIQRMVETRISGAPVVDHHGSVVGILTEEDCIRVAYRAAYHNMWDGKVSEYMNRDVQTMEAEIHVIELLALFLKSPQSLCPVVYDNRLVGEVRRRDIMKTLLAFEPHASR